MIIYIVFIVLLQKLWNFNKSYGTSLTLLMATIATIELHEKIEHVKCLKKNNISHFQFVDLKKFCILILVLWETNVTWFTCPSTILRRIVYFLAQNLHRKTSIWHSTCMIISIINRTVNKDWNTLSLAPNVLDILFNKIN